MVWNRCGVPNMRRTWSKVRPENRMAARWLTSMWSRRICVTGDWKWRNCCTQTKSSCHWRTFRDRVRPVSRGPSTRQNRTTLMVLRVRSTFPTKPFTMAIRASRRWPAIYVNVVAKKSTSIWRCSKIKIRKFQLTAVQQISQMLSIWMRWVSAWDAVVSSWHSKHVTSLRHAHFTTSWRHCVRSCWHWRPLRQSIAAIWPNRIVDGMWSVRRWIAEQPKNAASCHWKRTNSAFSSPDTIRLTPISRRMVKSEFAQFCPFCDSWI